MGIEEYIKMIGSVGFPVVITIYVLMRLENSMRMLDSTVKKLIIALVKSGVAVGEINGESESK